MNTTLPQKTNRLEYIDCAKGIGILLVIIGHTVNNTLRCAIYSFHMPLFFMLSCATYHFSKDHDEFVTKFKRSFRHIVFPAIIIWLIRAFINLLQQYEIIFSLFKFKSFIQKRILMLIFSSGVTVPILNENIQALGMPWFLITLFLGRTIFDYMHLHMNNKKLFLYCSIMSVIGVLVSHIQWLPFNFDVVLAILPLLFCGTYIPRLKVSSHMYIKLLMYFSIWFTLLSISYITSHTYLELACRRYTLYPLCYIISVSGTLMILEFSVIISSLKITLPLKYLGKNSLFLLCIHMLDSYIFTHFWKRTENIYINTFLRIISDVIIFCIIMYFIEKKRGQNLS